MEETQALVKQEPQLFLTPVMNVELAKSRLRDFQEFIKGYLVEGEDFGIIPGTPKPTLLKPGADKLCEIYGLTDTYEITSRVEDWNKNLFDYEIRCTLSKRDGTKWAEGMGSCNSFEGKYRWRDSQRKCPSCGKETIIKGKAEYGGGWLCFAKKGGCGAKFKVGDQDIEGQTIGRSENDDIATLKNTILKMAKKRAKVDATLAATRSSGVFTQDMEDITHNGHSSPQQAQGSIEGELVEEKAKAKPNEAPSQFKRAFDHEIEKKIEELKEIILLPCFTDSERETIYKQIPKIKALESIDKMLSRAMDAARKRSKEQAKKDKEAELGKQLEIGAEEAVYADSDQAF